MPRLAVIGLCLLFFLLAGIRLQASADSPQDTALSPYNGQRSVEIQGIVDADPELKPYGLELRLRATQVKSSGEWTPASGGVLVQAERFASYRYGDLVNVQGKLATPSESPGFNYRAYLARQGIASVMRQPKIEVVQSGYGNWLLQRVYSLRQRLARSLAGSLPEPQASLANGVLLGLRGDIPREVNEAFTRSGTTHLLAISGQNITIVVGIIVGLAAWALGRRRPTYLIVAAAVVWLFSMLVGGQPPVIRAAVMASVFLGAEYAGRPGSAPTALALAAAVMAGISPSIVWDVSFQLSFLSMAGLVYLAPRFQELAEKARLPGAVALGLSVSLGALLATWPVMAYDFGRVSLVGLPATALASPALPVIMLTSGLAATLGTIAAPLGIALGWVAWLPLTYLLWVAKGSAAVPSASLTVQSFPPSLVAAYYAVMAATLAAVSRWGNVKPYLQRVATWLKCRSGALAGRVSWKWASFVLAPATVLLWTASLTTPPGDRAAVSFLDVKEGEAILIRTPARHYILIDGGGDAQSLNVELAKRLPFWKRKLDLVVLTTPRAGNVGGLVEVLERYWIKEVWQTGPPPPRLVSPAFVQWERLLDERGIRAVRASRGLKLIEGDYLTLETLYPPSTPGALRNGDTLVLRLKVGVVSFLFASDIDESVERELVAERVVIESTVLKVANHGGAGASSEGFLARVKPSAAVVTAPESPFQQPDPEVMRRLRQRLGVDHVYITPEHGSVDFTTDGKRLWVRTGR